MKHWQIVAAAVLAALGSMAAPAADNSGADVQQRLKDAQERLEKAAAEVAELSMSAGDGAQRRVQIIRRGVSDGPMLGVGIDTSDQRGGGPAEGVRVVSVSPGGPAAEAGIKANDVIRSVNGKALRREGAQAPSEQLLAAVRATKEGEALDIEYERGGKLARVKVTPRRIAMAREDFNVPPQPLSGLREMFPNGVFNFRLRDGGGFGGAELVELSPTLGKYFGTDKGLLVVRAPRDEQFKLQDGDVILDIDGRTPASVAHAMQILGSYQPGENLKLRIMRQQKRVELQLRMPAPAAGPPRAVPPAAPVPRPSPGSGKPNDT